MNNVVSIHGKPYMTVAGRVEEAHKNNEKIDIRTEIVTQEPLVIKATVITNKGTFTAHAGAYNNGMIEKQSPIEVCETSAIGRCLGFAGYGIVEGIATADEVKKAQYSPVPDEIDQALNETYEEAPKKPEGATEKQLQMIAKLLSQKKVDETEFEKSKGKSVAEFSKLEASRAIEGLLKLPNVQ